MNDKIIIMGIDPGINNTGICILKLNKKNNEITLVDRFVIKANEAAKKQNKDDAREYGNVFSIVVYEKEMLEIFSKYNPDFVACEDAFYSPRTPNAFVSLKLCINAIQRVLYQHFRKQLYKIPPKLAKSAVSQGTADKVAVQISIRNLPDLKLKDTKMKPLDNMVEHEADSIAIGYAFVKCILPDIRI